MYNSINKVTSQLLKIPKIQRLNLELMSLVSRNELDGAQVVQDLLDHKSLWQACIMDREASLDPEQMIAFKATSTINLTKLRDMGKDTKERIGFPIWNVNTLYILVNDCCPMSKAWMFCIAKEWNATEVEYLSEKHAGYLLGGRIDHPQVLRVYWK